MTYSKKISVNVGKTCSYGGCAKKAFAKGLCRYHYKVDIAKGGSKADKEFREQQKKIQDKEKAKANLMSQLSPADLEKMFLTPCKNRAELLNFIKFFFNLHLPDVNVSRYTDTNPFDALWELYQVSVLDKNIGSNNIIYCASRGSGKCSEKGTLITTKEGPKAIEHVTKEDLVWTGWSWQPVVETFDEGIKEGVRITTKRFSKDGAFSLTGSLKHRIQALNPNTGKIDWIFMKDLVPGQIIYKTAEKVYKDVDVTSEDYNKGWIIGSIAGDGHVSRHNNGVSLCSTDSAQIEKYCDLINSFFNITPKVKQSTRSSVLKTANIYDKHFREWHDSFIEGELCYFKKLKTLEHSPNFLAGFISGLMETDGSKGSITLANPGLVRQISQILTLFGVHSYINTCRRPNSITKFKKDHIVEYHEAKFSKLPDYLLPHFSKRETFTSFRNKQNDQFRYPSILIKPFAEYIKDKYKVGMGYWYIDGVKSRSNIKFADALWSSTKNNEVNFIQDHKIDSFIELAEDLKELEWRDYLKFIRNGYYETVNEVKFNEHYFYDLEIANEHSYTSNGFVSHNTLIVAMAQLLSVIHGKRDVVHVGAILSQAERCYQYVQGFLLGDKVRSIVSPPGSSEGDRILRKDTMSKSILNTGGRNNSIEILPCTLKAVNGPHVSLVTVDEIDTLATGEQMRAYKDISGMLDSRDGKKAIRVDISTRKSRHGLMNQLMENAEKQGKLLRKWTVFEFMERCPDSRSGTAKQTYFINQDKFEVKLPDAFAKLQDSQKKEYLEHEAYVGCQKCALLPVCFGDAKKQTSKSPMLKTIQEVADKVLAEGPDWCISQLMNLKPSVEGIVFKEFDEKKHICNWNQMWAQLTNTEFPGICDHDTFVSKCHSMKLAAYAGEDFGWSNPSTIVVFFVDKKDTIYVVRTDGQTYVSNPTWIHHIKTKWQNKYKISLHFPDSADPGNLQEMAKAGLAASDKAGKSKIETGVQIIKKWLRAPGSNTPKIFIAEETCKPLIKEFQTFHYKSTPDGLISDDFDKGDDHYLDGLRYAIEGIFGKAQSILSSESLESMDISSVINKDGQYLRAPSPSEWAKVNNITVGPDSMDDRLGKIGRFSEIESDEEEDSGGGSGFNWSF